MVTEANAAVHTAEKRELFGDRGTCCPAAWLLWPIMLSTLLRNVSCLGIEDLVA